MCKSRSLALIGLLTSLLIACSSDGGDDTATDTGTDSSDLTGEDPVVDIGNDPDAQMDAGQDLLDDSDALESLSWTDDIQPVMAQYCSGCHGVTSCSTGICWLNDYDIVSATANNTTVCGGSTRAECLPVRISNGSMPPGGCLPGDPGCITDAEFAALQRWVDDGFPE